MEEDEENEEKAKAGGERNKRRRGQERDVERLAGGSTDLPLLCLRFYEGTNK